MSFAVLAGIQSCAGGFNQTDSFTLILDDNFMQTIKSQASQRNAESDESVVTIAVTLSGEYSDSQSKTGTLSSLKNESFNFTQIPVRATFDLRVAIYRGEAIDELNLIYEGTQFGLTVAKGSQAVTVAMQKFLNTPIVLYEKNDDNFYNYSLSGSETFGGTDHLSFCFDKDENLYTLKLNSENSSYTVCKDGVELAILGKDSFDIAPTLMVDMATNTMYTWFMGTELVLVEWPNLLTEGSAETYNEIKVVPTGDIPTYCTIYNKTLYVAATYSDSEFMYSRIYQLDISSGASEYSLAQAMSTDLETSDMKVSSDGEITDMLYQDGSVYLLVRDYYNKISGLPVSADDNSYCYYSRGAVIRYDVNNKTIKTIGWTSSCLDNTNTNLYASSSGSGIYYTEQYSNEIKDDRTKWVKISSDNTNMNTDMGVSKTVAACFPKFYVPKGLNNKNSFYGPEKFIALKPKKLIVSDDGVAFYTDSNGAYNVKNVNRIVEIDLEKFAISSDSETSVSFNEDLKDGIVSSAFTSISNLNLSNCIYTSNRCEYNSTSTGSVNVSIPLGE